MHVWTVVSGNAASIASGTTLQPAEARDQDVLDAALLEVGQDLQPELRALGPLKPHPEDVAVPVKRDAQGEVQRAALDRAAVADLEDHAVQEHDRIDVLQRALGPLAHVIHDRVGDAADEIEADLNAVDLLQVRADVTDRQPTALQREDLLVEPNCARC